MSTFKMNAEAENSTLDPEKTPGRLPKTVVSLGWVSFLTDVSSEMIFSLLPAFLSTLPGAPAVALGWIEGVAEATASAVKVVSGRVTDVLEKKKPLVLSGYGLSAAVRPLIALATAWPAVLALRFLDRIGKGVRSAPRDTIIASVTAPNQRGAAYGLHRAFDNAGAVLGPLLGAALLSFFALPLPSIFALSAIPGLLSVLVLVFFVKEASAPSRVRSVAGPPAPLPASFKRAASLIFLFTLSASSDSFLLLKARETGMALASVPLLWAFSNFIRAAFSRFGGGLSDRVGRRKVLLGAWSLYAVCYALFAFVTTPLAMVAVFAVYSLHSALSEGTERALIADLVPHESRGRAFGWFHGLCGLAALPASVVFGALWQRWGSGAAFLTGAGIAAAAALGLLLFPLHAEGEARRARQG